MAGSSVTPPLPNWESLSLQEQVAQMVIVRASGHLFDHQIQYPAWEPPAAKLQYWLQTLGVGGVILLGGTAAEVALRSQQLQDWANIPLLISADIEEGVGQRFAGATWFAPPLALSAIATQALAQAQQYAEQMGATTAQEALAVGINWVLAPIVDVNNNPNNPVINVRAFGETPEIVSQLTTAFIRGAQRHRVLTTAKHFPGHGDTATDSHLELPVLPHSATRLAEVELPPFTAAIAAGVDAVMTAHLQIPAWDSVHPATLSRHILTTELRQNLGFDGLIVTDALIMGAIANRYGAKEAPVMAVEAGADLILMPLDPEATIQAVCEAVETGRIPLEQIHASVERIWRAKFKVCAPLPDTVASSHAWENLPPPPIQLQQLAQPDAIATAENILQDSMQVHCPRPIVTTTQHPDALLRNLVLVDDILNASFLNRVAPAIATPQTWGYKTQIIDCHTPAFSIHNGLGQPQPTLLQLFIRGNPFRSSANLTQIAQTLLKELLETNELEALVIYGSPYVLEQFQPHLPPGIPYVFTYGQMPTAQAIALDSLFTSHASDQSTSDSQREFTT